MEIPYEPEDPFIIYRDETARTVKRKHIHKSAKKEKEVQRVVKVEEPREASIFTLEHLLRVAAERGCEEKPTGDW